MRLFGVEEELLIVDAVTLAPAPYVDAAIERFERDGASDHELTVEFKQEQIEVVSPPQATLDDQIEAIRTGRALADKALGAVGGRVLALPILPFAYETTLSSGERYDAIAEQLGYATTEHMTCGFHVHVEVESHEEGVAILDRMRPWLPTLLALSANSPYWRGVDSGYASYRYQMMSRLPTTGPSDAFGSAAEYDDHCRQLLDSGVPLDPGMIYFDARLSVRYQTLEVRVADISLTAERAGVIAGLIRALGETVAREWRDGGTVPEVSTAVLRVWMWQASRFGVESHLIDPVTHKRAPARDVVGRLLQTVRPVADELGEMDRIESAVDDILTSGTGAHLQRQAYTDRGDVLDIVRNALDLTHR
ncbi:glutamate--cysteine ligase [Brevibacterium sp.]|uniref:carboxylate-amine ligase n=1 Tax=Brevibacterium sp. TaxID=1701 RepID=UPI00281105AF|nr:glutamate--cysteine ligase [Brevibacterium sp.]